MPDFDASAIVPSTRDLFQAIGTKRRSLALVALVSPEQPAEEAARLHELDVSALAFSEAGPAMAAAARATKTVPSLCLGSAADRDDALRARFYGADGICVDAALPIDDWDRLAKQVRTTRMLPLALAVDAASADAAVKAGARAVLLRTETADQLVELARALPRSLVLLADVARLEGDGLRALVGQVDAAVVRPSLHAASGFADLIAEVDP